MLQERLGAAVAFLGDIFHFGRFLRSSSVNLRQLRCFYLVNLQLIQKIPFSSFSGATSTSRRKKQRRVLPTNTLQINQKVIINLTQALPVRRYELLALRETRGPILETWRVRRQHIWSRRHQHLVTALRLLLALSQHHLMFRAVQQYLYYLIPLEFLIMRGAQDGGRVALHPTL